MKIDLKAPTLSQDTAQNAVKPARSKQKLSTILSTAFLVLSAVTLLLSNGLLLYANFQTQQDAIFSNQLVIAQRAVKTINGYIENNFAILSTMAWQVNPNEESVNAQTQVLTSLLVRQPNFNQFILFDTQNKETATASRIQNHSRDSYARFAGFITDEVLNQTKDSRRYISSVYYDDFTGAPLVVIAVPMTDVLGKIQGTLVAELNLISIWPLVNNLEVGKTGYVYVVDSQGNLVAFKDTNRVLAGENVVHISKVQEFVKNPEETTDTASDTASYTGLTETTVVGTFVPLGTPQWAVVIETPIREAYQEIITRTIQSTLIILSMIILAWLVGAYLARRLATPLAELTNVANQVAGGKLELQAIASGSMEVMSLASAFNSMTMQLQNLIGSLEGRVTERTADLEFANQRNERRAKQFEAIATVANAISSTSDLDALLAQTTSIISREFGHYHVGIFLMDGAKEYAVLSAANSPGGQTMLIRGHKLKVGETGMVGFVTNTGKARVALDTGMDAVFFNNPDLPDTRSEIAMPLRFGEEIIGALDVQSTEPNAFSQEDINILGTLADQVSVAIQNSQQFEETRKALSESEALSRQFIQTGWQNFTKVQKLTGIHHTGVKSSLLYAKKGNSNGEGTLTTAQLKARDRGAHLSLPLKLHGEVIGSVDVRSPDNNQWDQDELDIVTAIIERAALSMENARLLTESQRLAAKERTIGDISTKISAQNDIDDLLKTAAQELGLVLPGMNIAVQFKKEESE